MILSLMLSMLPSFLSVPLHRLRGYKIGRGVRIKWGTIIRCKTVSIGDRTTIGPFAYLSAKDAIMLNDVKIKPLTFISVEKIELGQYVQISGPTVISGDSMPNAFLKIGHHSRIFPFCWIEPGEGITMGNDVGVGGYTQIFTHGAWPNYLKGADVKFGPITVADNVYIGWRAFIMPDLTIGTNSIIGANSLVNRSIPANTLVAGNPAVVKKQLIYDGLSEGEQIARLTEILQSFSRYKAHKGSMVEWTDRNICLVDSTQIYWGEPKEPMVPSIYLWMKATATAKPDINFLLKNHTAIIDLDEVQAYVREENPVINSLIAFLRKFGIRLFIQHGYTISD